MCITLGFDLLHMDGYEPLVTDSWQTHILINHYTVQCLATRPKYIYDTVLLNSSENEKCFRQKLQRKSNHTFYV